MTREDKRKRAANLIVEARMKHGITQKEMADSLGVSVRTIQNWEHAEVSIPYELLIDWFLVLNEPPAPYLKRYMYGMPEKKTAKTKQELVSEAYDYVNNMTLHELECFCYIMSGVHGSSPAAYMQKTVADLQSPIGNRLASCVLIQTNYQAAAMRKELTNPNEVQPNMEMLNNAVEMAKDAFHRYENSYISFKDK